MAESNLIMLLENLETAQLYRVEALERLLDLFQECYRIICTSLTDDQDILFMSFNAMIAAFYSVEKAILDQLT